MSILGTNSRAQLYSWGRGSAAGAPRRPIPRMRPAPPPATAACPRRGHWWARPIIAGCSPSVTSWQGGRVPARRRTSSRRASPA
eukprot:scaffold17106_cov64-Isochrysis_galbana.AAC.1